MSYASPVSGPSDVFLIRHAEAVSASQELRDSERHLTAHGRTQARALGDRLRWHDCEPTHIWTSPLVRAVQTAELVANMVNAKCVIETQVALTPEADVMTIIAALALLPEASVVMLFGHQPTITEIASDIVRRDVAMLANAEAVRIHRERVRWRFRWDAEAPSPKP
ncbi:histidine phosphatase family protein [soil metagenome]